MALCLWKSAAAIGAAALLFGCQLVSGLDGLEVSGGSGGAGGDISSASGPGAGGGEGGAGGAGGAGGKEPCPKIGCEHIFIDTAVPVHFLATDGLRLYWANRGGLGGDGSIWRAAIDGTEGPTLVVASLRPQGLVFAKASNLLFWLDISGGPHRVRYVGAGESDGAPKDLYEAGADSMWRALAISPDYRIFWVDANTSAIYFGGFEAAVANFADTGSPYSLATDDARIYWFDGTNIMSASHDGNNPSPLTNAGLASYGIAVDSTYVYWTERTGNGSLRAVSKTTPGNPATIANDLSFPTHVLSDGVSVYWASEGGILCESQPGVVFRMPAGLDGGLPETLASEQRCPSNFVQAGGFVYWGSGKRIFHVPVELP